MFMQFSVGIPVIFVFKVYWIELSHDMVKLNLSQKILEKQLQEQYLPFIS